MYIILYSTVFLFPMAAGWVAPHRTSNGTFLWTPAYREFCQVDNEADVLDLNNIRTATVITYCWFLGVVDMEMVATRTVK